MGDKKGLGWGVYLSPALTRSIISSVNFRWIWSERSLSNSLTNSNGKFGMTPETGSTVFNSLPFKNLSLHWNKNYIAAFLYPFWFLRSSNYFPRSYSFFIVSKKAISAGYTGSELVKPQLFTNIQITVMTSLFHSATYYTAAILTITHLTSAKFSLFSAFLAWSAISIQLFSILTAVSQEQLFLIQL